MFRTSISMAACFALALLISGCGIPPSDNNVVASYLDAKLTLGLKSLRLQRLPEDKFDRERPPTFAASATTLQTECRLHLEDPDAPSSQATWDIPAGTVLPLNPPTAFEDKSREIDRSPFPYWSAARKAHRRLDRYFRSSVLAVNGRQLPVHLDCLKDTSGPNFALLGPKTFFALEIDELVRHLGFAYSQGGPEKVFRTNGYRDVHEGPYPQLPKKKLGRPELAEPDWWH